MIAARLILVKLFILNEENSTKTTKINKIQSKSQVVGELLEKLKENVKIDLLSCKAAR